MEVSKIRAILLISGTEGVGVGLGERVLIGVLVGDWNESE
jgi:hypothetical protein